MKRKRCMIATVALICFAVTLTGCSQNEDSAENSKETVTSERTESDELKTTPSNDNIQESGYWKQVDESYYTPAEQQGHLERLVYQTDGRENAAIVYVPYGYDSENVETRYDILYLQHGGGGDETVYMGDTDSPNELKNMVDHMIENGEISPMLIVMPMLETEGGYSKAVIHARAFPQELMNDLMPAVESEYHTYAAKISDEDFRNSRSHRAFGGFSMGSVTTWAVFSQSLDYIRYFMPMSGDSFDVVNLDEESLDEEFFIFAATGSEDFDCSAFSNQIEAMREKTEIYHFKNEPNESGNLMFHIVPGNSHNYEASYEYIYNGLPLFFKE